MKFKIISAEELRESLSNLLMHHYCGDFSQLKDSVFLKINEEMFKEFKKRPITDREIKKLTRKFNIKRVEENLQKIKKLWEEREEEILETIEKVTNIKISTESIVCNIDPYTSHGFYGENNISIGTELDSEAALMIISHELFHIFYWKKLRELGLSKEELGKEKKWEWDLAEVTVYLVQNELKKFWPNIKIELYPETKWVYDKIKEFWKKESFENYLIKSYKILKNE